MSTESSEQYRAGFEAWMQEEYKSVAALFLERTQSGLYKDGRTDDKWRAWTASKREASTEPSEKEKLYDYMKALATDAGFENISVAIAQARWGAAGALPDEAKAAAYLAACKMGNVLYNALQQDVLPEDWRRTTRETLREWDDSRAAIEAHTKAGSHHA